MFDNDVDFSGKHATYIKEMARKKNNDDLDAEESAHDLLKPFERYIDVYMNAAVWGLYYKTTAPRDTSSKDRARIYASAFATERANCSFLYRLAMLLDQSVQLTPEERIDRAFRYDTQEERKEDFKRNMELFHSYIRGGIEMLYEQLIQGCNNKEECMERMIEVSERFNDSLSSKNIEGELERLLRPDFKHS